MRENPDWICNFGEIPDMDIYSGRDLLITIDMHSLGENESIDCEANPQPKGSSKLEPRDGGFYSFSYTHHEEDRLPFTVTISVKPGKSQTKHQDFVITPVPTVQPERHLVDGKIIKPKHDLY